MIKKITNLLYNKVKTKGNDFMKFKYAMPTEIYFGENSVLNNKEVFSKLGSSALIVTGRNSAKKNGSYNDVAMALKEVGVEFFLFDEVEENPSLETIEKGSSIGKENNVDFVIGIGGGSPMDAAKAMAIFIKNPKINADNIFDAGKLLAIPVVEVATTSGTGSEVTQYSIVTSNKDKTKKNLGQTVFPKAAFLDYKYTSNLSHEITVNTALDAFTHLVEGYLNSNSTFMSDIYGEKGFELFNFCFDKLLKSELSDEFREKVMLASTIAGIQIAQNGTSLPHGMGYPLTYFKGIPHGLANAALTMEYLKNFKDKTKIDNMLKCLKLDSLMDLEQYLKKLVNINIDITEEEILDYSNKLFSNKDKLKNHPENVELTDIVKIYSKSLLK